MLRRVPIAALILLLGTVDLLADPPSPAAHPGSEQPFTHAATFAFTEKYCVSCHSGTQPKGGLDLESLKFAPGDSENFLTWVKVHDRVQAGEMPPKERKLRPDHAELSSF